MHPAARRPPSSRRSGGTRALLAALALLLAAAVPAGCTGPLVKADCDERLHAGAYDSVLRDCPNPYHIASAYLGKAGLNMFDLVSSTAPPGDVTALLGLTAANIDQKRRYINLAVQAVANPQGGNQAFAQMLASFLGMAVTMEQFLDNGTGATALDGIIAQTEIDAALAITAAVPVMTVGNPAASYLSVVSGTTPYTIQCITAPCDNAGLTDHVYEDATGAGVLNTAALPAPSTNETAVFLDANAGTLTSSSYPTQFLALTLPLKVSPAALADVNSFTGMGDPGAKFEIGMTGYLGTLALGTEELARTAGSSGGTEVATQINALMNRLDNGAFCAVANPVTGPLVAPLNELYALYLTAAGTPTKPVSSLPAPYPYLGENLLDPALVPSLLAPGIFNLFSPVLPALPTPTYPVTRYKLLFPTVAGLAGFDAIQATQRVDQAEAAFRAEFESIPVFAPAASAVGDGKIDLLELLCAAG